MASDNQLNQARQGNESTQGGKSARGFASMDPERQRAIASEGGRAAHQSGNAHQFSPEEAREAGRRGGQAKSTSKQASKQQDAKR